MLVKVLKDHQKSEDAGRWDARLDVSVREPLKLVSKKRAFVEHIMKREVKKWIVSASAAVLYMSACFQLVYWSGSTLGHL